MKRSLTLRLIVAFLVVSITGTVLSTLFVRWSTVREFNQLILNRAQEEFIAYVSAYHEFYGSWDGLAERLERTRPAEAGPAPPNNRQNWDGPVTQFWKKPDEGSGASLPRPLVSFVLVDRSGKVVAPAGQYQLGDQITVAKLNKEGVWIEVNGEIVGAVLPAGYVPTMTVQESRYLARTEQALRYAAIGATIFALVLGVVLARTLTHPLRELTAAIRSMSQGQLEQRVVVHSQDELGELAASFNQMSAALTQSNTLRRQMTADIAHDLRTPLTVIGGYLESLRDGVLKPTPDRFEMMYSESQHLQRLVEDLRTLSLADAGELTMNLQPISPQALLEQLKALYVHQATQQQVALEVTVAPDLPDLTIDPDRMMRVLSNLVSNALRYTPTEGTIFLIAQQVEGAVQLLVRDTGAGIAQEDLPRVFDRFYRGDKSRQTQENESGLGLAIAKSIVALHKGTIAVESTLGEGTTFMITLPVGD